ncbi:MAG: hypothetical protein ACJ71F_00250, partial [Nitrososphaeraceae archaeon]
MGTDRRRVRDLEVLVDKNNLKYLGRIGNVFHTKDIEAAIEKGRKYDPDTFNRVYLSSRSMG